MDKAQAIHSFWSGFGLTAYDELTYYDLEDGVDFPHITYNLLTDAVGDSVTLDGNVWYRSTSWETITKKVDEIAAYIGTGGKVIPIDTGYVWIRQGTPFSQRVAAENDDKLIRRVVIQIDVEYLTAY